MKPVIYLHDGSFEGLLNAVAHAIKSDEDVQAIYAERSFNPQLFDTPVLLETDSQQAQRLFEYLKKLGGSASRFAVNGFLSDDAQVGIHLLEMVRQCLVLGAKATQLYSNESIQYLDDLCHKVSFETHRFTGLIRFRILDDGLQYAPFEPDCMVIGYVALHFKARFHNRRWILHDIGRNQALYWDGTSVESIEIDDDFTNYIRKHGEVEDSRLSEDESYYQKLWSTFHTAIANMDRKNRNLQRQYMPKRYWKYLVEMR